ncbi:MAG: hypothetical protein UV80_C0016G0004 [Candidatus Peregrinibacteria bacterium GW2011_GWF2_43_17]|nr:MAG: hypothetical protein UV80_C0016G0004 [Candidatus Peregrinibacteria bacterium GW2011_GWF2_43_17]KKT18200.1 MAG: hypothetical protein UW03_C0044G0004 [Candidatus Peregrinibacteria bacterium GW2011_GWA2_43_8]
MLKKLLTAIILLATLASFSPAQAADEEIEYLEEYDISYITESNAGEDVKMTLYDSKYPAEYEFAEYTWICFLDNEEEYTGECVGEVWQGESSHNGRSTNYVAFILPADMRSLRKSFQTADGAGSRIRNKLIVTNCNLSC